MRALGPSHTADWQETGDHNLPPLLPFLRPPPAVTPRGRVATVAPLIALQMGTRCSALTKTTHHGHSRRRRDDVDPKLLFGRGGGRA